MTGRLLIRLPNWLGDGLMARPLLHALRRQFPSTVRAALGPAAVLDLLAAEDSGFASHVWPAGREGRGRLARELRRDRAAAALILPGSFSSAWFALQCGARERIGYAGEGRSPLLTRVLRRPARGERHLSEEYGALGEVLGAAAVPLPVLPVPDSWRARSAKHLERELAPGAPFAILAPGAAYGPAKRWPADRFARLGDSLAARGLAVVLCGAASDEPVCREVGGLMRTPAVSVCGQTSLTDIAGLCATARLVVSNDSGLAHLAGAVGAFTVVIFGSTSSGWSAPLGPRVRVVQRAPVCSPCFRRTCAIGYRCLTAVTVEAVKRVSMEFAA
ncbi:MAG: lipopolysaccharide heptosyltransferase II [Candidatus Eisenbacteria bacterium]